MTENQEGGKSLHSQSRSSQRRGSYGLKRGPSGDSLKDLSLTPKRPRIFSEPAQQVGAISDPAKDESAFSTARETVENYQESEPENWYHHINEGGPQRDAIPFVDGMCLHIFLFNLLIVLDDPPFYLRRSSDDGSIGAVPMDGQSPRAGPRVQSALLPQSLQARIERYERDLDTFRDVVDDLTVQNKRLKRKLNKYEMSHPSRLGQDKLFEVKVHNLPPQKKTELEDMLHCFVSNVEADSHTKSLQPAPFKGDPKPLGLRTGRRPSSPSTANSKPPDSAYASMSASDSVLKSQSQTTGNMTSMRSGYPSNSTNSNVKSLSHLHSESLLPSKSPLSESSKEELVVQKLELLFTEAKEVEGPLIHSSQQPILPRSTVIGELEKLKNRPTKEHKALWESQTCQMHPEVQMHSKTSSSSLKNYQISCVVEPEPGTNGQLHMDTSEENAAVHNLLYLQRLGLASPLAKVSTGSNNEWIYLNLLINMAQLHTLNVTPAYVRRVVTDMSSRLELSDDGSKVRWLGDQQDAEAILNSTSNRSLMEDITSSQATNQNRQSPASQASHDFHEVQDSMTRQVSHCNNGALPSSTAEKHSVSAPCSESTSKLPYKPLFVHQNSQSDEIQSECDELLKQFPDTAPSEDESTQASQEWEVQSRPSSGPMTFFSGTAFCTDLSGDFRLPEVENTKYYRFGLKVIGENIPTPTSPLDTKRSFSFLESQDDSHDAGSPYRQNPPLVMYESSQPQALSNNGTKHIDLEASGLGGVYADDNFAIDVHLRQTVELSHRERLNRPLALTSHPRLRHLPPRIRPLFESRDSVQPKSDSQHQVQNSIVSTSTKDLPPAPLPPPSYAYSPSSSGSEDDGNDCVSVSDAEIASDYHFRPLSHSPPLIPNLHTDSAYFAEDEEAFYSELSSPSIDHADFV